jgi:hypothetical protein
MTILNRVVIGVLPDSDVDLFGAFAPANDVAAPHDARTVVPVYWHLSGGLLSESLKLEEVPTLLGIRCCR